MVLPLGTPRIWTDDDTVLDVQVFANPPERAGFSIEIINGDIEEPLNLTGVKIHCDDVVATGGLKHVCHEFCGDWRTGLVLLVLAGIREVWNHSGDAARGSGLACIDHNQQLHESIIDVAWWCGLQDEDCVVVSRALDAAILDPV